MAQVRAEIRKLRHINSALEFFDARLAQIETFVLENFGEKTSDRVMKEIEKLLDDLEKEVDSILKDLRKLFKDFGDFIDGLEDDELVRLLYVLIALSHVEVCDDGVYFKGDLIYEFDDKLGGLCCPFG